MSVTGGFGLVDHGGDNGGGNFYGGDSGCNLRARNYCGQIVQKKSIGYMMVSWIRPKPGGFKLNTDGASKGNPGPAYCGGIIRDSDGRWVSGFHRKMGSDSSIAAELSALLDGLTLAKLLGLKNNQLEVEVDATQVLELLADIDHDHGDLNSIILACRHLLNQLGLAMPKHVYREANQCADMLANLDHTADRIANGQELKVFDFVPVSIADQLLADATGVLYPRTLYA